MGDSKPVREIEVTTKAKNKTALRSDPTEQAPHPNGEQSIFKSRHPVSSASRDMRICF